MGKNKKNKKLNKKITKFKSEIIDLKHKFKIGNMETKEFWFAIAKLVKDLNLKQFISLNVEARKIVFRKWDSNKVVEYEVMFFNDLNLMHVDITDDQLKYCLFDYNDDDLTNLVKIDNKIIDEIKIGKPFKFNIGDKKDVSFNMPK